MKLFILIFLWATLHISVFGLHIDLFDAIGKFALNNYPGKSLSGLLCWKNENVNKLTLKLNQEGIFFHNFKEFSPHLKENLLIFDSQCENFLKLMNKEKQKQVKHVFFVNTNDCDEIPFGNYQFPLVKLHILDANGKIQRCSKPTKTSPWLVKDVAQWDYTNKDLHFAAQSQSSIANPKPSPIEVTFLASPQTVKTIKDFRRHLHFEAPNRFNHQLFQELFTFLNLTPAISFTPNAHSLDNISPTSKELIGLPLKVTRENLTTYDFITTFTPNHKTFLMRAPSLSAVSNVFTLPLELNVWYASYVLLAIIFVTLIIIVRVEWRFPDMIANKYRILYPHAMDVIQMQVGAIAQQGSEAEPTSGGGRIATFMIFLFFLFLYTAYSANIVALLGSTTTQVHGVRDLKDFNVKLGIDREEFSKDMFQNQDTREHRALYKEKLAKDECYMSLDDGIGRVRNEFFAFHADADKIYKMIDQLYTDNEKCGFVEIPYLSEAQLLVPIRKDSMYKEILKVGLALFLERGLHRRIKNIIFAKQPQCYNGGGNFVSVSLLDCYFAFVIYGGGTAVSLLLFVCEMLVARTKLQQRMMSAISPAEKILERSVDEEGQRLQSGQSTSSQSSQVVEE